METMFNNLEKYLKNFYLLKEIQFDDFNTYVFDYYGYYLVVHCDKENNTISDIISEYY